MKHGKMSLRFHLLPILLPNENDDLIFTLHQNKRRHTYLSDRQKVREISRGKGKWNLPLILFDSLFLLRFSVVVYKKKKNTSLDTDHQNVLPLTLA